MKKLLFSTLLLSIFLTGCSGTTQTSQSNQGGSGGGSVSVSVQSSSDFKEDEILNSLTTTTYTWHNTYNSYLALIVKNNSSTDCSLEANVLFKNADGATIGASDASRETFEANTETCLIFSNEEPFTDFTYEYSVSKLNYYDCVTSGLQCEVTPASKKAVISVTNNGDKIAEWVTYTALFMQGENVVSSNWGYIMDDDSELKIGKTITEEASCFEDFDSVKVFLSGRAER